MLLDALLLATVGVINRSPWLLGFAALAGAMCIVVLRLGRAFDRRRTELAASRAELKGEAQMLAESTRESRDS